MFKLRIALFAALVIGLALGCEGKRYQGKLTGKVTYKGQPVKGGNITLIAESGGLYNASISSDGSYEFVDVAEGNMKVTIETETVNPNKDVPKYGAGRKSGGAAGKREKMASERRAAEGKGGGGGEEQVAGAWGKPPTEELAKLYVKIPAKYGHPQTSGLTVTIERGNQTKNFELTD
jgi:hypothetical protein